MKFLFLIVLGVTVTTHPLESPQPQSLLGLDFTFGSNRFAADVYKEIRKTQSGNFLVCPLSAETVLALAHAGAGGTTASELEAALHFVENKKKTQESFRKLTQYLHGNENYTLSSANKVYVKDGYKIKDEFKTIAVNVFEADIQNIDFEKSEQAASEMNRWVEEKTHNKIQNLINAGSLNAETRSILINAMYFRGKWATPFDKAVTSKRTFYLNNKDQTETDMMEKTTTSFKYYEDLNAKFLEMPYAGDDLTMTIGLPNDKEGLDALEEQLESAFTPRRHYPSKVHARIPKFSIRSTIQFVPILQALGVKHAFRDDADFHEILFDQSLKISDVVQKTFIEVEEEGTTAAAATGVIFAQTTSALVVHPPIKQFIADRPFIFYIKLKDLVLFTGRYTSPE